MADQAHIANALQSAINNVQAGPNLPPPEPPASAGKRKHDDSDHSNTQHQGQPQARAKRSRYISIACNECKRRKIKCNGENPCQRCGNLTLECIYAPNCCSNSFKDSVEFKDLTGQLASLQGQVNFLLQNLNSLRSALGHETFTTDDIYYQSQVNEAAAALAAPQTALIDPALQLRKQGSSQPSFQGPTSPAFSLGIARSSLQSMGITEGAPDESTAAQDHLATELARAQKANPTATGKDPLYALNKDEALRLCTLYEDEIGLMNPVVEMQDVKGHANIMYTMLDAAARILGTAHHPTDTIHDEGTDLLRLVLAIALVLEGTGQSELGTRLFDSVNSVKNYRLVNAPTLKDIQVVILMSIYHFHVDNEDLAWRIIGLAARLALELGLHRIETYDKQFPNEPLRSRALEIFWSIYVLDRRWSYGTGRGFALQETDFVQTLPRPLESVSPYLAAMIQYSTIATQAWKFIASAEAQATGPGARTEIGYLDYEILQWLRNLPEQLRYVHPGSAEYAQHASDPNDADGRALYKLRVILYLRANQARLSIYRPMLSSATSILTGSPEFAQTPVDVAKDTIRILHHVNMTSESYRTHQITFNYFLLSALAALFLAVSHAPAQFAEGCRDEFYMALELVRGLSAHSYVSKRLWRTISGLKKIGPKIGLYGPASASVTAHNTETPATPAEGQRNRQLSSPQAIQQHAQQDPYASAAAMAMTGLTDQQVDGQRMYMPNTGPRSDLPHGAQLLANPTAMANDLTSLFEAAGIFAGGTTAATMQAAAYARGDMAPMTVSGDDAGGVKAEGVGGQEELNRVMHEMF